MGEPVRRRCAQAIVTWLALTLFALPVLAQQPAAKPPPCVMSRRAVLDDARMNLVWTRHVERLVGWLGEHGFERLDGAKLAAWMSSRIQRQDAYGSVVVLPRGISPIALFRGAPSKPLWLQYLRSGGRIVHLGDLPWSYAEASTPEPNELSLEKRQLDLLGMQWTSNGHRSDVVTATDAAREWGIESGDGPATGFPAKQTTTPFHVYTAPSGEVVATDWFRNIRADRPWSGLVKLLQRFDGDDDAALRSVWRAALYCGTPIAVPALPSRRPAPATTGLRVTAAAGGVAGRHELVRGEQLELTIQPAASLRASEYRVALVERGATRLQQSQASSENKFLLDTAPFADGSYQLQVDALLDGKVVASATDTFGIRYLAP
jgi:hypothetical protein